MNGSRSGRWTLPLRSARAAALLAGLVAVLVYANALGNGFAYDDLPVVAENEAIHDLSRLPANLVRPYWGEERGREAGIWRPVTTAVLSVEWALWGDRPAAFHGVNVLAHGASTGLATLVLAHLAPPAAALLGGLLFAVHPVHVEAVANVVGVAELLSALFVLTACLVHLRAREGGYGRGAVFAVVALYALAFLSKESGAVLPGLLVVLDAWKDRLRVRDLGRYLRRRAALLTSLGVTAVVVLAARVSVLGGIAGSAPPMGAELLGEIPRIWTLPLVWLHYLRLLFVPASLSPDYAPSVIEIQLGWGAANAIAVILALGLLGLSWAAWREREVEELAPATLWILVALLPVANVLFLSEILLAERTLYVPSLAACLLFGTLFHRVRVSRPRVAAAGAVAVVVLMSARTWTATPVWKDTSTVMGRILELHPESGRAQWMLADLLLEQNEDPSRGLRMYSLAVMTTRGSFPVVADLVDHLIALDRLGPAGALATRLWEDRPDQPRGPARLAVVRTRQGRPAAVVAPAEAALSLEPENGVLHHLAANAYAEVGPPEEALDHRRAAIRYGEGGRWLQWRWLADLQLEEGDTAGAVASLDSARSRAPDPAVRSTLETLAREWAKGGDRDGGEGVPDRSDGL